MTTNVTGACQAVIVRQAGLIARSLLEQNTAARVMGITSRGIFIALHDDWVIFLTSEPYSGPLTVNLETPVRDLQMGADAMINKDVLTFTDRLHISGWREAKTWEAPCIRPDQLPMPGWFERLRDTSHLVAAVSEGRGLVGLLEPLLELDVKVNFDGMLLSRCRHLKQTLQTGEWHAGLVDIRAFLGYGSGLTPSGDDLILGLLLGLTRIPVIRDLENISPEMSVSGTDAFITSVVQTSRRQTTSLSASLIACAAQGQADERLVSAFDGIYLGSLLPEECTRLLLAWGSTSGGDSLVGMALAFMIKYGK